MGWAFLPPLQRTLADPILVSRPHDLSRMLPAWRDPSFASHELTHVVSPVAPSGVIDGDGAGSPQTRYEPTDLTLLAPTPPAVQRAVTAPGLPSVQTVAAPARTLTRTSVESLPVLQLTTLEPSEVADGTTAQMPAEIWSSSEPEPVEPSGTSAPDPPALPSASLGEASSP